MENSIPSQRAASDLEQISQRPADALKYRGTQRSTDLLNLVCTTAVNLVPRYHACLYHLQLYPDSMHRADSWIRSTIPFTKIKLCDFVIYISAFFCMYAQPCNRKWSQLIFIPGNKFAHTTSSTKVWRIRKYWKEKGIDLWDKCIFESHFSSEYPDT